MICHLSRPCPCRRYPFRLYLSRLFSRPFLLSPVVLAAALAAFAPAPARAAATTDISSSLELSVLWTRGDFVSHLTLVILVIMSVASWGILVSRLAGQWFLGRHTRQSRQILASTGAAGSLEALAGGSPCQAIAVAGVEAARHHHRAGLQGIDLHTWVSLALRRALARASESPSAGLPVLATVASTSPFVGLFGTVWGIRHALATIGASGQASLDQVAGPVGEALVMTAIGLAVAVPAVLGYNLLARRARVTTHLLREFSEDVHALVLGGGLVAGSGASASTCASPGAVAGTGAGASAGASVGASVGVSSRRAGQAA